MSANETEAPRSEIGWMELGGVEPKRLLKHFGQIAARFGQSQRSGAEVPKTWLLEKQAFRRALKALLPGGHGPLEIAAEPLLADRALMAARAHDRLLDAHSFVPTLPSELTQGQFLVWSSPALKPRGIPLPGLCRAKIVQHDGLVPAICEVWASLYFEKVLARLPRDLSKLEIAIGVTVLEAGEVSSLVLALLPEAFQVRHGRAPWPSLSSVTAPLGALERSVLFEMREAMVAPRGLIPAASAEQLLDAGSGDLTVDPDVLLRLVDRASGPGEKRQLLEVFGSVEESAEAAALIRSPREWLGRLQNGAQAYLGMSELGRRVETQTELVAERARFMRELDLALLPDDGLTRTIDEFLGLYRESTRLAAESALAYRRYAGIFSSVSRLEAETLEAGLSLKTLGPILAFEEAMRSVRGDERQVAALKNGTLFPSGPGAFALSQFALRYPELFGPMAEAPVPVALLRAARLASAGDVDIVRRCRAERKRVEEIVERASLGVPNWLKAWLSPLRQAVQDACSFTEEARFSEVRANYLLLRVFVEVDRRMLRLEPGLSPGTAFHLTAAEVREALDMRGASIRARSLWRRAAEEHAGERLYGLGALREMARLLELAYGEGPISYGGRASDTVPVTARALGRGVVYETRHE